MISKWASKAILRFHWVDLVRAPLCGWGILDYAMVLLSKRVFLLHYLWLFWDGAWEYILLGDCIDFLAHFLLNQGKWKGCGVSVNLEESQNSFSLGSFLWYFKHWVDLLSDPCQFCLCNPKYSSSEGSVFRLHISFLPPWWAPSRSLSFFLWRGLGCSCPV